jgi:ABC-type spermidine/putrescine transport system permease subunit I
MIAPASIVVTIGIVLPIILLFRYSLNQYTPAKMMVDAFTLENYVKFFTDPFYLAVLFRTIRVAALCTAICVVLAFPMAYCLARTRSRFKNLLLMAVILPLFVGNAVRAAGWMVLFGNRGFVNASLMGSCHARAVADHVHGACGRHRHHCDQPAVRRAYAAGRARGHRPRDRGGGARSRCRAVARVFAT